MPERVPFAVALMLLNGSLLGQTSTPPPVKSTDSISVTADRSSSPLGEASKTAYTLDPEQLRDYPALTLEERLGQHAGFELFRRAPSRIANPTSEGISLRGLGSTAASRTLVLLDGAPLNDSFGGYIHWNELPQQTIQSVTLVTGGGSDLYGSSALGGVIDIIPARPEPARFELSGAGGAQATSDLQAGVARQWRAAGLLLAGQSLRTGGYIVTDPAVAGRVDTPANVRSQAYRAELGRRDFASDRVFLTGNLLDETRANGTPLQTNGTRLWRYLGGWDRAEGRPIAARARVFGSQQGYRQSFSAIAADRNSELLTRLQRVHTQEFGATGDATLRHGSVAAVVGADLRDLRATDNETPIMGGTANGFQNTSARQRFVGGFGELLAERKPWSGAVSLRTDRASNLDVRQASAAGLTAPPNRTEIVLSPRVGVTRVLGAAANVHASAFRAFRTPTFNELYRTGQVGSETTLANPALLSERATGFELGTALTRRLATLQVTYFWTIINRPVSAVLIAQTPITLTNLRENLGQIRSRGVELALDLHPSRALSASLGYQYADATVTRFSAMPAFVGKAIPQVPRQSFTAQLRASERHAGELTVGVRAVGRQFDDSANQFPLAGFFALDVSGRRSFGPYVDAFMLVQNVTDRRPQVSRTPVLTLGSPLFAEAGLRLHFGGTI